MPKVSFAREGVVVDARPGQTLLEIAESSGISIFRGMWPGLHCRRWKGWCNRCKVWVKPLGDAAVNPPTGAERAYLRLNGRVSGTLRLACQVAVNGEVEVHTRAGGSVVLANVVWEATTEPSRWKDRWEKRARDTGDEEPETDAAAEAAASATAKQD